MSKTWKFVQNGSNHWPIFNPLRSHLVLSISVFKTAWVLDFDPLPHSPCRLPDILFIRIGYTPRCRSLHDLHYRGPQARGGVGNVETEPRCITDLYHGAMGYAALTTHPWPSNYSVGHKRFWRIPSNSSNHRRRALSIESNDGYRWSLTDAVFYPVLTSSLMFRTTVLSSLCRIIWPHSCCVDFNLKKPAALPTAESALNRSTHN